jgi:cell division protein FtsQ
MGGQRQLVNSDARVLRGAAARDVPVVSMRSPFAGDRIRDARTRHAIEVLAAAPPSLRSHVERAWWGSEGLVLQLEDGPALRFGGAERIAAKWMATARVLADTGSRGATYIDVRYPERPAAGGLEDPALQARPDAAPSATGPTGPVGTGATLNP